MQTGEIKKNVSRYLQLVQSSPVLNCTYCNEIDVIIRCVLFERTLCLNYVLCLNCYGLLDNAVSNAIVLFDLSYSDDLPIGLPFSFF